MPRIYRTIRRSAGRSGAVAAVAGLAAVAALPSGALAARGHTAHILERSSTPPRSLVRLAPSAARRAARHHGSKGRAHSAATLAFTLPNPPASCDVSANVRPWKTLTIGGPKVPGVSYANTVYWREVTWPTGAPGNQTVGSWHSATVTPFQSVAFGADHFYWYDFYTALNQTFAAGVEVWRYSAALGWESAATAYLPIKHTYTNPFPSTFYSYEC